jgi:hypothetical protein
MKTRASRAKVKWRDPESNRGHHDFQKAVRTRGRVPICRTFSGKRCERCAIRLQGFLADSGTGRDRRCQLSATTEVWMRVSDALALDLQRKTRLPQPTMRLDATEVAPAQ